MKTAEVAAVMEVAGVEAAGCWESKVQLLEVAGGGSHWQREVQAVEAAAMEVWKEPAACGQMEGIQLIREGAARAQPEGAARLARVQPGKGATSVAEGA